MVVGDPLATDLERAPLCVNHRRKESVTRCAVCGAAICQSCLRDTPVGIKCAGCAGTGRTLAERLRVPAPERGTLLVLAAVVVLVGAGGYLALRPYRPPALPPDPATPPAGGTEIVGDPLAAAIRLARQSTVRVLVEGCDGAGSGSGFVAAPRVVVTNAHVVAGMDHVVVQRPGGRPARATVVLFDPELDVAVLRAERDVGPPLSLDQEVYHDGIGAVIGYPLAGPLSARPATIVDRASIYEEDIYGDSLVRKDIYQLRVDGRPGSSGGPFVLPDGEVGGVLYAGTGPVRTVAFALASTEVVPLVETARGRTAPASTGRCADD